MKLGSETGSLVNSVMAGSGPEPVVGMGATILRWSDRTAGTIIKVTACTITVREDKATRTDSNGQSESQSYTYAPDPDGSVHVFRKTKKGWRTAGGGHGLLIGQRAHYYDPSF